MRLYIGAAKRQGIAAELIFALFNATAAVLPENNALIRFHELLEQASELAGRGAFSFTRAELDDHLFSYLTDAQTPPPVSHSEEYRRAYSPHYRIVDARFIPLFELCKVIFALKCKSDGKQRTVIAFDGRCASGKTTAAELISRAFNAEVIRCDDFFLPPGLRTHERYAEPGGNIHYERFAEEVLAKLPTGEPFEYGVFDCSEGRITRKARVGNRRL